MKALVILITLALLAFSGNTYAQKDSTITCGMEYRDIKANKVKRAFVILFNKKTLKVTPLNDIVQDDISMYQLTDSTYTVKSPSTLHTEFILYVNHEIDEGDVKTNIAENTLGDRGFVKCSTYVASE